MTWDVPVKDDCPECEKTMFKKSGRGQKKPFCINELCPNFLPEDQRGYKKKTTAPKAGEEKSEAAESVETGKKPAAKKTATKKTATKKTASKKTATPKKTTTKKATGKTAEKSGDVSAE